MQWGQLVRQPASMSEVLEEIEMLCKAADEEQVERAKAQAMAAREDGEVELHLESTF
jgi:hypothetical protein